MKARDFIGSYLKQEDLEEPTLATITGAKSELVGEELLSVV